MLATRLDVVVALGERVRRSRVAPLVWAAGLLTALALLVCRWLFAARAHGDQAALSVLTDMSPSGGMLLVVLALEAPLFARLLEPAPARFLGRVSFSLYLVHVPLIVVADRLIHPIGLAMVAASLVVAALFYLVVERHAHGLSERVGRWAETRWSESIGSWREERHPVG